MKKLIAGLIVAAAFNVNAGLFSSDIDDALSTVRNSVPGSCDSEVGEMVDAFFDDAKWKASKTKSGRIFVNVEGAVDFRNQAQRALMQFEVAGNEFWLNVLKLDGRQQSNMMMRSFANHMCDAVK